MCRQYGANLPSMHSNEELTHAFSICACPTGMCVSNAACLLGFRDDQRYSTDAFESNYLTDKYNGVTYLGKPWQGAIEKYNGGTVGPPGWRWTDNTEVDFTHWTAGEPNDSDSSSQTGEDCTGMWTDGTTGGWYDLCCNGNGYKFCLQANLMCKMPSGCAQGLYQDAITSTCKQCAIGTYQNLPDSTECILCPAGRYGNALEETRDTCAGACEIGHYCPLGSTTSTASKCPAGRFAVPSRDICERLMLLPFCSVVLCFVVGFSSPQGASSCMANACTPTQVSHSNFNATGSITGVTGQVSNLLVQAAYLSPVILVLACICIYVFWAGEFVNACVFSCLFACLSLHPSSNW